MIPRVVPLSNAASKVAPMSSGANPQLTIGVGLPCFEVVVIVVVLIHGAVAFIATRRCLRIGN